MKRAVITAVVGCMIFSSIAGAATNIYSPPAAMLHIPAGASKTIAATVGIESIERGRTYFTWALDTVNGNLPKAWIRSSPGITFLSDTSPSLDVAYTISVPEGTPSGTYSGYIFAKAMSAHGAAEAGKGMFVQVTVPSQCSGIPKIIDLSITPETIWPPNRRFDTVTVKGTVEQPEGCKLLNFGHSIVDDYGIFTSTGNAEVSPDRTFAFSLPVEAWRDGTDSDGRHYRITVFAEDEAGIGLSETLTAVVPHDKRDK